MALSSRGRRSRHKRRQAMAEINVTPMVDVMLVLLVIFMVAAPMLTTGVTVELPESEAEALPQASEPPLAVSVTSDGRVYVQTTEVTRNELVPSLEAMLAERDSDKIYLRADGANSYGTIFEIMGQLSAAGYHNIGLVGDIATN